jgi:putative transposase
MPQSYGHVYLHVVFGTKHRESFLTPALHQDLARYITPILHDHKSIMTISGGMADHVHLLLDLGREVSVAVILRELKAKSSAWRSKTLVGK